MAPKWVVKAYDAMPEWLSSRVVRMVKGSYPVGVMCVVFDQTGRVLLLQHTYRRPVWRLPGGLMDRGEQPDGTAVREVREEANCDIQVVAVVDAVSNRYSFDVAVAARLIRERPFKRNSETAGRKWVEPSLITGLRQDQARAIELAGRHRMNHPEEWKGP